MLCWVPVARATTVQSQRVSRQRTLLAATPVKTATTLTLGMMPSSITLPSPAIAPHVITASMPRVKTQPTSAQPMSVRIATRPRPSRTSHESTTMPCWAPVAHATTAQSQKVSQQPTLLVETPVMTATTPTLGQTQNLTTHQSLVIVHRVITALMQRVKTQPTSAQPMSVRIATRPRRSRTSHESTTMPY